MTRAWNQHPSGRIGRKRGYRHTSCTASALFTGLLADISARTIDNVSPMPPSILGKTPVFLNASGKPETLLHVLLLTRLLHCHRPVSCLYRWSILIVGIRQRSRRYTIRRCRRYKNLSPPLHLFRFAFVYLFQYFIQPLLPETEPPVSDGGGYRSSTWVCCLALCIMRRSTCSRGLFPGSACGPKILLEKLFMRDTLFKERFQTGICRSEQSCHALTKPPNYSSEP